MNKIHGENEFMHTIIIKKYFGVVTRVETIV
jgi:hypothetical protein